MGFLSDLFKPQQRDVVTTQERTPFGQAQPGLESSFGLIEQGLNQGPFTGQRVAGFDPAQTSALQNQQGIINQGNSLAQAAANQTLQGIGFQNAAAGGLGGLGQFGLQGAQGLATEASGANLGSNPFLDQRFAQGADRLRDQFGRATAGVAAGNAAIGRFRGGGGLIGDQFRTQEDILGQNLRELESGIFSPAFEADRNRQVQAQQQLAQLGIQGFQGQGALGQGAEQLRQQASLSAEQIRAGQFADQQRQFGLGETRQIQQQRELDAQMAAFNDPFNRGAAGLAAIGPVASQFGTGTNTTPTFGPSVGSQLIGGAASLAGMFFGGPAGAAAGGALGSAVTGGGNFSFGPALSGAFGT